MTHTPECGCDEPRPLHPTHHWGKRPTLTRDPSSPSNNVLRWVDIPCCLNCLVDGYEDEPAAFQPCRRGADKAGP